MQQPTPQTKLKQKNHGSPRRRATMDLIKRYVSDFGMPGGNAQICAQ